MRVIATQRIAEWSRRFPDAASALAAWLQVTLAARWQTIADVRRDFPHADGVAVGSGRTATVFNIRGNRYRLITAIHYRGSRVYTMRFLSHADYDKRRWVAEL
jgi:mRNA interferase HigB